MMMKIMMNQDYLMGMIVIGVCCVLLSWLSVKNEIECVNCTVEMMTMMIETR